MEAKGGEKDPKSHKFQPEKADVGAPKQEPGESWESYKKKLDSYNAAKKKTPSPAPSLGDLAKKRAQTKAVKESE